MANKQFNRRTFLGQVATTAAFTLVPRCVLGGANFIAPSEKTTLAGIGMGGQGTQNMIRFQKFPEVQIVAVCDVNREGGGYLSWNWSQGKNTRLAGREPARRALEQSYAQQKGVGRHL